MELHEEYESCAAIWRWAARAYVERSTKVPDYEDKTQRTGWEAIAHRATLRAARYARLAAAAKPKLTQDVAFGGPVRQVK